MTGKSDSGQSVGRGGQTQAESEALRVAGKPPLVEVERALNVTLNLDEHCETAGTYDGINLTAEGGDGYIVTPMQLRVIAKALEQVADEREAQEAKR
jgi:hypothetical protein